VPIGFRREFAAVRNAELLLCRARAVLKEQEHLVLHDAAASVGEFERAAIVAQTAASRLDAARTQLQAVGAAFENDKAPLDLLLESQRLLADAESRYYRALAEYAIAIKNVHFSKGTLLDYDGVQLSESCWPTQAYSDAAEREMNRGRRWPLNYASSRAPLVTQGAYDQQTLQHEQYLPAGEPIEGPPAEVVPLDAAPIEEPPAVDPVVDLRIPVQPAPARSAPAVAPVSLLQPAAPSGR